MDREEKRERERGKEREREREGKRERQHDEFGFSELHIEGDNMMSLMEKIQGIISAQNQLILSHSLSLSSILEQKEDTEAVYVNSRRIYKKSNVRPSRIGIVIFI